MIYIALLRGINVGGHKRIKMADLRLSLESMGMRNVQTYIQSGNIVFESEENAEQLTQKIEQEIESVFGFNVPVMLRNAVEMDQIVEECPYSFEALDEGEGIHLAFLAELPSQGDIDYLHKFDSTTDTYQRKKRNIYLFFKNGTRNSKLPPYLNKLNTPVTIRNWKTIRKLTEMIGKRRGE